MTLVPARSVGVGVASNFRRAAHVSKGLRLMKERFGRMDISRIYKSSDFSSEGAFYWNLAVKFESPLDLNELKATLKSIEVSCGRLKYSKRSGRVCLDLDILVMDGMDGEEASWINGDLHSNLHGAFPLQDVLSERSQVALGFTKHNFQSLFDIKVFRHRSIEWNRFL